MNERIEVNHDHVVQIVLSKPLAQETREIVRLLRDRPNDEATRRAAVALLHEAADANMSYYFLIPARQLRLGSIGIGLLNMGTRTVLRLITSVGHRVVGRLSAQQLSYVADFVEEQLLLDHPEPPEPRNPEIQR